jgi:hypothetical protein
MPEDVEVVAGRAETEMTLMRAAMVVEKCIMAIIKCRSDLSENGVEDRRSIVA